jgi:hypothetical protein
MKRFWNIAVYLSILLGATLLSHIGDIQAQTATPQTDANGNTVYGSGNVLDPTRQVTISSIYGTNNTLRGDYTSILGGGNAVNGIGTNVVGSSNTVLGNSTNVLGNHANVYGDDSTCIGDQITCGSPNLVSPDPTGTANTANNPVVAGITAIGAQSSVTAGQGTAIGTFSQVSGQFSTAIGYASSATANNCIALGAGSTCDQDNTVAVGNRRLVALAAGQDFSDAATVGQLYPIAGALGGGAGVVHGQFVAPTYSLSGGTFQDVGSALSYLDNRISGLPTTTPTPPPVSNPNAVTYDDSTHQTVTMSGQGGTTISNVRAGVADMDAANVGQVKQAQQAAQDWAKSYTDLKTQEALAQANQYTDSRFNTLGRRISAVGAMSTAQSNAAASLAGVDSRYKNRIAGGFGEQGGLHAVTIMYQHVSDSGQYAWNVSGTVTQGGGASIGVGFSAGF